jgi:predicted glutamine amidotransferase
MCELLGMSANVPTDICFSFAGLMRRGGGSGPHRDGWGVAFYEGKGVRCFHDPNPCHDSAIAKLVESYPIKSENVICHIRQANVGAVSLANTHPFTRELWGQYWAFAHNGQLASFQPEQGAFRPVGDTDSEALFCHLLNTLTKHYDQAAETSDLIETLSHACHPLLGKGVCNIMLSNGDWLFTLCTSKLHWITRRAPFGAAHLSDVEVSIDFTEHTTSADVVTVIATEPLTRDEQWTPYQHGEWRLWQAGETVLQGNLVTPAI